jgi:hypothetical protein
MDCARPRFFYAGKILSMTGGMATRPLEQNRITTSCARGIVNGVGA